MKRTIYTGLLALSFAVPPIAMAQVSMELEQACRGDIDLTDFVVNLATSGGSAASDFFSNEEKIQINVVLNDENIINQPLPERVEAVMVACSEGRILQARNSEIINP
jgi:hypothetical protein